MRERPSTCHRTLFLPLGALGLVLVPTSAEALDPFTDGSANLNNPGLASGVAIGVTDMNGDGLDDIVRLDDADSLEIEYQQADGSFSHYVYGSLPGSQWGMALGDIDGNGYLDVFAGGAYNGLKILQANDTGDDFDLTVIGNPSVFTQCANFADIDNNGTLDLFVCHDDGLSAPFSNDGSGNFTYDTGLINPVTTIPSDNSGNYGSVWSDYDSDGDLDLYIAKCRLGVNDPMDGRRVNLLFDNDGSNNYSDVAEAAGLRPLAQSWAMDFGDIDNDGDMDAFLVNHSVVSQLYENQGDGTFVDITPASGMNSDLLAIDLGIQAHFEDFDNDTLIDLLVTGREGEHRLFMNNGDHTFTADLDAFPTGGLGIQSAVVGDLDADGFQDVVAGFATGFNNPSNSNPDRLFINPGNENNYLDVRLTGVTSNAGGVGARIELHGEWGVMVREIRAGESYGITNSFIKHFGLGAATTIDSIVVRWPSGQVDTAENPDVLNETVHIIEGCPEVWYADVDGDGYGDPRSAMGACLRPQGHVEDSSDCNDAEGESFPGNPEVCDEIDNDCNDMVDDVPEGCGAGDSSGTDSGGQTTGVGDTTGVGGSEGGPDGGPNPPADGSDSGGTDDAGAADDGGDGGCACDVDGRSGAPGWMLLMVGVGLGLRSRRRRA